MVHANNCRRRKPSRGPSPRPGLRCCFPLAQPWVYFLSYDILGVFRNTATLLSSFTQEYFLPVVVPALISHRLWGNSLIFCVMCYLSRRLKRHGFLVFYFLCFPCNHVIGCSAERYNSRIGQEWRFRTYGHGSCEETTCCRPQLPNCHVRTRGGINHG